jgi:hypothetical protein
MNRQERRKAAKLFELKVMRASDISGVMCAWKGCEAAMNPDPNGDLPPGWSWLLLTRSYRHAANLLDIPPSDCLRDAALCPKHTRQLDSLLEDLARELTGPAAGTA